MELLAAILNASFGFGFMRLQKNVEKKKNGRWVVRGFKRVPAGYKPCFLASAQLGL